MLNALPANHAEDEIVRHGELHTRYATARTLSRELESFLDGAAFKVEMRHNIYHIQASKDFNLSALRRKFEKGGGSLVSVGPRL
ncbi:hypothetical protein GQ53DRAFT_8348 [Thozetella sp. PMI_491]|nr:hypothetical protein GQ53DRAFT_8348 [Thozetella sp. PMI_491]